MIRGEVVWGSPEIVVEIFVHVYVFLGGLWLSLDFQMPDTLLK